MIILDTDVVFEAMRPRPDEKIRVWLNSQPSRSLYLSSVSVAELLARLGQLSTGKRTERIALALDTLLALFSGRVLPFDQVALDNFAAMTTNAQAMGTAFPVRVGQIAATAASRGFAVVTQDVEEFHKTGVRVIEPWRLR